MLNRLISCMVLSLALLVSAPSLHAALPAGTVEINTAWEREEFFKKHDAVYTAGSTNNFTLKFIDIDGVERSVFFPAGNYCFPANNALRLRIYLDLGSNRYTTANTGVHVGIVRKGEFVDQQTKQGYGQISAYASSY